MPDNRQFDELEVARELCARPVRPGMALTGPGGVLKAMTKTAIEPALDEEIAEHLGYGPDTEVATRGTEPIENGAHRCVRGAIEIDVPRDRAGTVRTEIVKKCQRRLTDVDEVALSLYAVRGG
jgi:transposase-like protein